MRRGWSRLTAPAYARAEVKPFSSLTNATPQKSFGLGEATIHTRQL